MNKFYTSLLLLFTLTQIGCAVRTHVVLPENTQISIHGRAVTSGGTVVTRPFFWSEAGGIDYSLLKEGNVIKSGKLRARFRPVSIFWPPFGLIYWPMGFSERCYDLTKGNDAEVSLGGDCTAPVGVGN